MSVKNKLDQLEQVAQQLPEFAPYMHLFKAVRHDLAALHYGNEALSEGVLMLSPEAVLKEQAHYLNRIELLTQSLRNAQEIIGAALDHDAIASEHIGDLFSDVEIPENLRLLVALKTIAEMPIAEQDNMIASNMRAVAQQAILGKFEPEENEVSDSVEDALRIMSQDENSARLQESIQQLEAGDVVVHEIPVAEEPVDIAAILRGENQAAPAEEPVETEAEVDEAVDEMVGADEPEAEAEEVFDTIEITDTMIGSRAVSARVVSGHINPTRSFMVIRDGEQSDEMYRAKLFLNLNNKVMDHVSEGAEFIFEPSETAPNLKKGDVLVFL